MIKQNMIKFCQLVSKKIDKKHLDMGIYPCETRLSGGFIFKKS